MGSLKDKEARSVLRQIADCIIEYAPLDEIRLLLASREDINAPVASGLRLLHYAVFHRHTEAVKLLLVRGANPNVMDDVGYSPMHLCAERGFCNVIRILLRYNARVDFSRVLPGDTAYGFPPRASQTDEPLRLALKNGYYKAAELLLKNGANPNTEYFLGHEINLLNPLDIEGIDLLLKYGADSNAADRQGMTLLMKACRNPEAYDTADLLITCGADVNAMTIEDQRTPLHYAVLGGNFNTVTLLVRNGACVRLPEDYKKPPPLFFAVLKEDFHMMRYLVNAGADVNDGSAVVGSALHVALSELGQNKIDVVKFLLEHGANPNAILTSNRGPILKPPLGEYFISVSHPDVYIVRLLLKYGAKIILLGQRQHPLGIFQSLHHIDCRDSADVLELVASAAEAFCIGLIERSVLLSNRHKLVLLQKALTPMTLKHISRTCIRNILCWGPKLINVVKELPLPVVLKQYLLFED
ncbi:ankyrin repeat and SOCS box protein 10-like [Uloborus diversus]|uniref:ankyrin repeat and SOCS box protein 10-like n=1 Tax=Uloborus diversus TaxID=327109 RepID=UPI00240930BD|nr:ankyrin repeat and SOCS box protein 10-like [Uloborus diversus]